MLFCNGWLRKAKLFSSTASCTTRAMPEVMGKYFSYNKGPPGNIELISQAVYQIAFRGFISWTWIYKSTNIT
jgi:hypothetical protein